jgi:hypothetical protein
VRQIAHNSGYEKFSTGYDFGGLSLVLIDILPALEGRRFCGQTGIAGVARLTSPNPTVDAQTA